MYAEHSLKTWPAPFQQVWDEVKLFEIRVFDRDYKEGDIVRLFEFDPDTKSFSGRYCRCAIRYVEKPGTWGLPPNIGVFAIKVYEARRIDPDRAARWCSPEGEHGE
jgi:ParB family chromosome partitioning protein